MKQQHVVRLTDDRRPASGDRGRGPLTRRQRHRAHTLPRADAGGTGVDIAGAVGVAVGTVANARRRFAAGGPEAALTEGPRPGAAPLLGGKAEAVVIALARGPAPGGAARRSARLLADRLVQRGVVESASEDTIPRVLKKATSSRRATALRCNPLLAKQL